jgi:hypothetical protein
MWNIHCLVNGPLLSWTPGTTALQPSNNPVILESLTTNILEEKEAKYYSPIKGPHQLNMHICEYITVLFGIVWIPLWYVIPSTNATGPQAHYTRELQ